MLYAKFSSTLLIVLCWTGLLPLGAQIALSPSFVFIDEKIGVGDLYVSNSSDKSYEISISFAFGYPAADSLGNLVMNYDDSLAFEQYALDPMIRAFPRSFFLPPREKRTVRLQVIPGARKKEGFFFTRLKVLAKPQATEVKDTVTEGITTQITFNFEQVTAVFYHKGKVSTGLVVKQVEVIQVDSILHVRPHLQRTGNSPFIGSMFVRLKDSKGNTVAESQGSTTAYFEVIRATNLKISGVPAGTYTLELRFETRRNDMMASDLVQAPPVVYEQKVEIK